MKYIKTIMKIILLGWLVMPIACASNGDRIFVQNSINRSLPLTASGWRQGARWTPRAVTCAYPPVEVLPDDPLVTPTYGHWTKGEVRYIVSVRLKLSELDAMAKEQK